MTGGMSIHASSAGAGLRQLWRRVQEGFDPPGARTQARPIEDPGHQAALSQHSLAQAAVVADGVITDCTAVANCYRVQLDDMHYPITAPIGS